MFSQAKQFHVQGSTFNNVQGDYVQVVRPIAHNYPGYGTLYQHVAPGAFDNSFERYPPPRCHPGTRKRVLDLIYNWIGDDSRSFPALWLHGPAGAGKSAIAQTVAEECRTTGTLAASFFFSRSSPGRDDLSRFIATISYQLASSYPDIKIHISTAVDDDPSIFSRSIETQMNNLIVQPLLKTEMHSPENPKVIIVDGLDECRDPDMPVQLIQIITQVLKQQSFPLCFFFGSRPEPEIRDAFSSRLTQTLTRRIELDSSFHPDKDIQLFLTDGFAELQQRHVNYGFYPSSPWPPLGVIQALVKKSSGHFVYASVVLKFIDSRYHDPDERLNIIMSDSTFGDLTPFADLDSLYKQILLTVPKSILVTALRVLGASLALRKRLNPPELEFVLSLKPGDIYRSLANLQSIVHVPAPGDTSWQAVIRCSHRSLQEFLLDRSRSCEFYIDMNDVHEDLTCCSLTRLAKCELDDRNAFYAERYWCYHCHRSSVSERLFSHLSSTDLAGWDYHWRTIGEPVSELDVYEELYKVTEWMRVQESQRLIALYPQFLSVLDTWTCETLRKIPDQSKFFRVLARFRYGSEIDYQNNPLKALGRIKFYPKISKASDNLQAMFLSGMTWLPEYMDDTNRSGEYLRDVHALVALLFWREVWTFSFSWPSEGVLESLEKWHFHISRASPPSMILVLYQDAQDRGLTLRDLSCINEKFLDWLAFDRHIIEYIHQDDDSIPPLRYIDVQDEEKNPHMTNFGFLTNDSHGQSNGDNQNKPTLME